MAKRVAAVAIAIGLAACGGTREKSAPPPQKTAPDREVLQQVNGAVNEAIRNQADCDAARPSIAAAREKIGWASGQLELPASRQTLDVLETQLDRVAQLCP